MFVSQRITISINNEICDRKNVRRFSVNEVNIPYDKRAHMGKYGKTDIDMNLLTLLVAPVKKYAHFKGLIRGPFTKLMNTKKKLPLHI